MRRKRSEHGALVGLTPLLDTLFLLLFALLSVARAETPQEQEQVRVVLPEVESEAPSGAPPETSLVLVVHPDATISVPGIEGKLTTLEAIDRALGGALADRVPEEINVEIQGDRGAPLGTVVALLQHLRLRGFARVGLLAEGTSDVDLTGSGTGSRGERSQP